VTLGKLTSFSTFFAETESNDRVRQFSLDDYESPYLQQLVENAQVDPIGRWPIYWRTSIRLSEARTLATWAAVTSRTDDANQAIRMLSESIDESQRVLATIKDGVVSPELATAADELHLQAAVRAVSAVTGDAEANAAGGRSSATSVAVMNPSSAVRRTLLRWEHETQHDAIYAQGRRDEAWDAVADLPGCGFALFAPAAATAATGEAADEEVAPEVALAVKDETHFVLRTEFLEARIDQATGALSSLHDFASRGNRLSQRLVSRSRDEPASRPVETVVMEAETVRVLAASAVVGCVQSTGRLLAEDGAVVARFEQTFRVSKGSRIVEVEVVLTDCRECSGLPWNDYLGLRSVWAKEHAEIVRCVNDYAEVTTRKQFESPLFVEIRAGEQRTALLWGGLPFHRRSGPQSMDTPLRVAGETTSRFRYGLGVDLPTVLADAGGRLSQSPVVACEVTEGKNLSTGWLFHLDSKRVAATDWRPIYEESEAPSGGVRRSCGVRFTVSELTGQVVNLTVRAFRDIAKASKIDIDGNERKEWEVVDGAIRLTLNPHEWTEVEARW
jgi:alpha-mannosidase